MKANSVPVDWTILPISSLVENIIDYRGRTPRKLGTEWGGGDIPALSARNVKMGHIDFEEETHFGSEALYKRWMSNGDPKKDDIVVTMEAPLGNVALIPDNRKYILSQRTILLQTNRERVCKGLLELLGNLTKMHLPGKVRTRSLEVYHHGCVLVTCPD